MENIYILHYTPLIERKIFMDKQLESHLLQAEYITKYDKEVLNEFDKSIFSYSSTFTLSNSSLILKHIEAYKHIISKDQMYGLIIEDDVILADDFNIKHIDYYKQLPENWDILFYGDGWKKSQHVPESIVNQYGGNVFLKSNSGSGIKERNETGWPVCAGSTRCSDCYIIKNSTAKSILSHIEDIRQNKKPKIGRPSDMWMNHLFRDMKLNVYWGEPTISTQGTETGLFKSSH